MLILTRSTDESLMIGDDIEVVVLGIKGNQVRIGVRAPRTVSVDREEIYRRKLKERERARPGTQPTVRHKRRRHGSTQVY